MSLRTIDDQLPTSQRPIADQSATDRRLVSMSRAFKHMTYSIRYVWLFASKDSGDQLPTYHDLVADRFYLMQTCCRVTDQLQTCRRLVGNYNLYPNMDIKWLHKSHRSPVSCKEISRKQVANRSRSRCKQGLTYCFRISCN